MAGEFEIPEAGVNSTRSILFSRSNLAAGARTSSICGRMQKLTVLVAEQLFDLPCCREGWGGIAERAPPRFTGLLNKLDAMFAQRRFNCIESVKGKLSEIDACDPTFLFVNFDEIFSRVACPGEPLTRPPEHDTSRSQLMRRDQSDIPRGCQCSYRATISAGPGTYVTPRPITETVLTPERSKDIIKLTVIEHLISKISRRPSKAVANLWADIVLFYVIRQSLLLVMTSNRTV